MKRLASLKTSNIKVSSFIEEYLFPQKIYLEISNKADLKIKSKKVYKGQLLYIDNNTSYYSPVSGHIIGINNNYLEIENDFKEEDNYKGIDDFTTKTLKLSFKDKIHNANFDFNKIDKYQNIIVSGIEDQPYIINNTLLLEKYTSEILEMLDLIYNEYHKDIIIVVKDNETTLINKISSLIGSYPYIKVEIVPNLYPIGNKNILSKYLNIKEFYYFSSEDLYYLYEDIVKDRRRSTTFVTISGNALDKNALVNIKIGTPLNEVINALFNIKEEKYKIIKNGLLNGEYVNGQLIIDQSIRAIYIMKDTNIIEKKCILCGKCNNVCPFKCNPYLSLISKGKYRSKKCINCGLCTYICPSNIKLGGYVK